MYTDFYVFPVEGFFTKDCLIKVATPRIVGYSEVFVNIKSWTTLFVNDINLCRLFNHYMYFTDLYMYMNIM